MNFNSFYEKFTKKNKLPLPAQYSKWVEACLALQIHTEGVRPRYRVNNLYVEPETYEKKFENLFATRLLNRHPNENPEHYNWRLSQYKPVSKELYDKFLNLCKGSILQPNNYTVTLDDNTQKNINSIRIYDMINDAIEFVLQNPIGFFAVIPEKENGNHYVELACIKCEDVLMYDEVSIAFRHNNTIYFIDYNSIIYIDGGEQVIFEHNLNTPLYWKQENTFLQPYCAWSEILVSNMNDDEAMNKHYSYPIVQMVEPECPTCMGSRISVDSSDPNNIITSSCKTCNGKGTMSRNPGEYITISEETAQRGNGLYDVAKFHTPDIGIPEYHLKRWQTFYERVEKSLYLKVVTDGTQSGDAKKEDRKDQYFFLQTISNYIFHHVEKGLTYATAFYNYSNGRYVMQEIVISKPKQFDLMSDSDLVNEFALLQGKTDDSQTLGELNYAVNSKVFRDDKVQLKINDVLYIADSLYGVSGNALRAKLLSGIYNDLDKTIHEKGYKLLVKIARQMGDANFVETDINTLINMLINEANNLIPVGIYA